MKKRLRKKLHKKYLNDVVAEISTNEFWRKLIFGLKTEILLTMTSPNIPKYLKYPIYHYGLRYIINVVDYQHVTPKFLSSMSDGEDDYRDWIFFKFQPKEFPELMDFSINGLWV